MSVHGICYDNGMSGQCNCECEQFIDGDCEAAYDVIEGLYNDYLTGCPNNLEEQLTIDFGDVKLWVLRHGEKLTDLELLTKSLGY